MMQRIFIAALLACLAVSADAVLVKRTLSENSDGTRDTAYPNGDKPIIGASCTTWTCENIGDATLGEIDEVSATELQMVVSGTSDGSNTVARSITRAYKTLVSGDAQIEVQVPATANWQGHTETFTGFGAGIDDGGVSDWFGQCTRFFGGASSFKHGIAATAVSSVAGEAALSLPRWYAMTFVDATNTVNCYTSPNRADYVLIGSETRDLSNYRVYAWGTSHIASATTSATLTAHYSTTINLDLDGAGPPPIGPRQGIVAWNDYEVAAIRPKSQITPNAGYMKAMAPPLNGTCTPISTTQGGADFGGNAYLRIVDEAETGIAAPEGNRFMQVVLHKNCDYNQLNTGTVGDIGGPKDKARSALDMKDSFYLVPFDEYVWIGYIVYFPEWPAETQNQNQENIYELQDFVNNTWLTHRVEPGNIFTVKSQAHASSVGLPSPEGADLRYSTSFTPLIGRWVEWIWRVRLNPFVTGAAYSCPRNTSGISGSTGLTYGCNRGSLEMWIDHVKVIDYDGPLGGVPHASGWGPQGIQIYKPSWKKRATSVVGPRRKYADGPFVGIESQGAGYQDVSVTRTACTDGCP